MAKTIVKKKDLQKLISESINRGKGITSGTPQLNWMALTEDVNNIYNKIRIGIVKEGYRLNIKNYLPILSEAQDEHRGHSPSTSAMNGIDEIIKNLQKAKEMWKGHEVGAMIQNSIIRLWNTMQVIGTYVGSGQRQQKVNPERLYKDLMKLKPIENKEVEGCEEGNADSCQFGPSLTHFDDF